MSESRLRLRNAPIVEAVVDIDCDLPPGFELPTLEGPAREGFGDRYPKHQSQFFLQHEFRTKPGDAPSVDTQHGVQALQFLTENQKQLVQVRANGFSFNRLAPYGSLDDYLPEIERTWRLFVELAQPVQVRRVRLRYVNRIQIPLVDGKVNLEKYLAVVPLPEDDALDFSGFVTRHTAVEVATRHESRVVLATQPASAGSIPVILDNTAVAPLPEGAEWPAIREKIVALRHLKNRVFRSMLTEECLDLFR